MKRITLIAIGLALVAAAVAFPATIARRWTDRIPAGWSWEANFVGVGTPADPETGAFPTKDGVNAYKRTIAIKAEDGDVVVLDDLYRTYDPMTGKINYEYIYGAPVDRRTGEHAGGEHAGEQYLFPRGVERRPYVLRMTYMKGIPLAFAGEESIDDLPTYVFSYVGRGEYTESYAGSPDYAGIRVEPGQEIRCAEDQFRFRAWVEPVTGEFVKIEESCLTGDYVFDTASGRRLREVMRWGGATAGTDVANRVRAIRSQRWVILWASRYGPGAAAGLGMLLVIAGLASGRRGGGG